MQQLGFRVARSKTIAALQAGPAYILFEDRTARESKNLLDTGDVSPEDVIHLLRVCRGSPDPYRESGHDRDQSIPVHTFKPVYGGSPAIFISVHKSNG